MTEAKAEWQDLFLMKLRDISFSTPQENIAFDEVLLSLAEKYSGGECLRFWESSRIFIVLGRIGRAEIDINSNQIQQDNVSVLRRSSGGGTVLQGPGCLNYTLILSKQKHPEINDLRKSYEWISDKVIAALRKSGLDAYFRPMSDLATGSGEKKFSGNAQRRAKSYILHHGTILYKFDLSLISRYLKMPQEVPEYRKHRPHMDFVTNVPIDPNVFKGHLAQIFQTSTMQPPSPQELSFLKEFLNS
ncbi:MAG: lipoate--protein ligase family protein [Candidatus Omnitrophica bacterium]|nr:lipoate--protein ligase family protein [Candidatus Omnitrophota bacterium]